MVTAERFASVRVSSRRRLRMLVCDTPRPRPRALHLLLVYLGMTSDALKTSVAAERAKPQPDIVGDPARGRSRRDRGALRRWRRSPRLRYSRGGRDRRLRGLQG